MYCPFLIQLTLAFYQNSAVNPFNGLKLDIEVSFTAMSFDDARKKIQDELTGLRTHGKMVWARAKRNVQVSYNILCSFFIRPLNSPLFRSLGWVKSSE